MTRPTAASSLTRQLVLVAALLAVIVVLPVAAQQPPPPVPSSSSSSASRTSASASPTPSSSSSASASTTRSSTSASATSSSSTSSRPTPTPSNGGARNGTAPVTTVRNPSNAAASRTQAPATSGSVVVTPQPGVRLFNPAPPESKECNAAAFDCAREFCAYREWTVDCNKGQCICPGDIVIGASQLSDSFFKPSVGVIKISGAAGKVAVGATAAVVAVVGAAVLAL
ncbi:hypothetical protein H9P43_004040 [Blastocladiella emersonii ATCC 22665]|nr:hypothetical protein H9P43_004040 [Blastocladiella emersonii ATCC 22665]